MKHGQSATAFPHDWIRPWYPAGKTGHIFADCEHLLRDAPETREGPGWLNPRGLGVCHPCLNRHIPPWDAECDTCGHCMCDEVSETPPYSEDDAKRWEREHQCEPEIQLIPPPPPPVPAVPDGQTVLFAPDLEDAAA